MSCPSEILSPADLAPLWEAINQLKQRDLSHDKSIETLNNSIGQKVNKSAVKDFFIAWALGEGLSQITRGVVGSAPFKGAVVALTSEGLRAAGEAVFLARRTAKNLELAEESRKGFELFAKNQLAEKQALINKVDQTVKGVIPKVNRIDDLSSGLTSVRRTANTALTTGQTAAKQATNALGTATATAKKTSLLQTTVNAVDTKVAKVNGIVAGLQTTVATQGQKIIANSKTLTKVSNVANSAFSKVGNLFTKIAPILNIAGFLLNLASAGFTAYAIAQLFSRMNKQEKLTTALYTALTFAGGSLLTAAYVKSLDNKIVAMEVKQQVDTSRIIGHVTAQHEATRTGVSATAAIVRSEHQTTRTQSNQQFRDLRGMVDQGFARARSQATEYYKAIIRAIANINTAVNTAAIQPVLNRLDTILGKIAELQNQMLGKFNKLWDYLKMDRVLNILTTAAAIHNAAMLSRNIGMSLIDTIGQTLGLLGLKDADGNAYDFNSIIGRSVQSMIVSIVGQDVYDNVSESWRDANRIITAGAAVVLAVQSVQYAIAEGVEITANWVAKIGNGLREHGSVSDNQWPWMKEGLRIKQLGRLDRFNEGLQSAEDVTSQIYGTVAAGVEIKESVEQVRIAKAALDQEIETQTDQADTALEDRNNQSESAEIDNLDLVKIEEI